MAKGDLELRMFFVRETAEAICVCASARLDAVEAHEKWIPRSLIGNLRKTASENSDLRAKVVFTLPEWKVEASELWDFVID